MVVILKEIFLFFLFFFFSLPLLTLEEVLGLDGINDTLVLYRVVSCHCVLYHLLILFNHLHPSFSFHFTSLLSLHFFSFLVCLCCCMLNFSPTSPAAAVTSSQQLALDFSKKMKSQNSK